MNCLKLCLRQKHCMYKNEESAHFRIDKLLNAGMALISTPYAA